MIIVCRCGCKVLVAGRGEAGGGETYLRIEIVSECDGSRLNVTAAGMRDLII
jgi:hypothetical protein